MKNKRLIHSLTIGFALFAMFFGAGNLILPPLLGVSSGDTWLSSTVGFVLTGVIAPFLGILSVLLTGESFSDLGNRINKHFAILLSIVILLSVGPFVGIPRTAATTYEIGVLSVFPNCSPILSAIIFFLVTLVLSISPSKVVDIIGKYLTPLLLTYLTILIVAGIISPLSPMETVAQMGKGSFIRGFEEGYQTMDVLSSVIFASIIIGAVKAKGYTLMKDKTRLTIYSGLVAVICLVFIYGGLVFLGATSGYSAGDEIKRTDLLLHISDGVLGRIGTFALAGGIALACLTTAIALTTAVASFFSKLTKGFLSYRLLVVVICVAAAYLSVKGVDNIIQYAYPTLRVVYPITLTMVLYIIVFGRLVPRKMPFLGAVGFTTVIALLQLLQYYDICASTIEKYTSLIPLSQYDLTWIVPSFVGFVLFYGIDCFGRRCRKNRVCNTQER